jgi:hypothetical protein
MDNKLLIEDEIARVSEIEYEGDEVLTQQKSGALAVNDLVSRFSEAGFSDDYELLALVLVRFKDLQVRDYAMGLATDENKDELFNLWYWFMNLAPNGYIVPTACIFAACAYESGEVELAHTAILSALADCPNYSLALLLRRVFTAGWPADSFATMRAELHPKICSSLFGGSI